MLLNSTLTDSLVGTWQAMPYRRDSDYCESGITTLMRRAPLLTSFLAQTSSPSAGLPSSGSAQPWHGLPGLFEPASKARGRLLDAPFLGRGTARLPWPCLLPRGNESGYAT